MTAASTRGATTPRQDGPSTMLCTESGWWEEERARFIRARVAAMTSPDALIADIGCGRGRLLDAPEIGGRTVINVDSHVWEEWRRPADVLFVCASADALPFRDGAFDLVGSFDVLEHIADDLTGLREQRRIVRRSGRVVAAVPAFERLWSGHDVAAGHFRRYRVATFTPLARRAGLEVDRATYFFSYLWLPAWVTRKRAHRAEPGNRTGPIGEAVRRIVGVVAGAERRLLRRRRAPFGTSLWIELQHLEDGSRSQTADDPADSMHG
jgi:SAM-dependent methyltransferase